MDDGTEIAEQSVPSLSQTDLTTPAESAQEPQKALSKSALKKAAKAERFAANKLERRAREKEAKKERKRSQAAKRAAGELDDGNVDESNRRKKKAKVQFGGRAVVDLGFDDMMSEKEIKSLCSQLAYTHSANRQASFPFSLVFTSLNGRTFNRLEAIGEAGYKRWANTVWWQEGYDRLWLEQPDIVHSVEKATEYTSASSSTSEVERPATKSQDHTPVGGSGGSIDVDTRQQVVYLTADSEDELTELKADETYIIGGICDHNRYKNLCLNKANESGVRTARLPIGRYLSSLPTRKVLTVNQVFEILVKWVETKDWEEAFYAVIPQRKFHAGGKRSAATSEAIPPITEAEGTFIAEGNEQQARAVEKEP